MNKLNKQKIIAVIGISVLLLGVIMSDNFNINNGSEVSLNSKAQVAALGSLGSLEKTNNGRGEFPLVELPRATRAKEALAKVQDKLPEMAAWYHMSPVALRKMMERDNDLWLDRTGKLFYTGEGLIPVNATTADGDNFVGDATYPLDQTFKLHSRPGSKRTIFIDFDGGSVTGTIWNARYTQNEPIVFTGWDTDGNPSSFSDTELQTIQDIWKRVAEDYAPFDVDVTTEFVSWDLISRDSVDDEYYGTWVAVDDKSEDWTGSAMGGVAYVGVFDYYGSQSNYYKPAWIFRGNLANNTKYTAEAMSHELGHNLGLSHDGKDSDEYYLGHNNWAPIMGAGYYKDVTQFSKGEYTGATNTQDDFAMMQSNGLIPVDDHADSISEATSLSIINNSASGQGVINTSNDVDVFSFVTDGGSVSLVFTPASFNGANLDVKVSLLNGGGSSILSSDSDARSTSFTTTLSAGVYYVVVDGVGAGDPSTSYSDYGSLGQYSITGTIPSSGNIVPPVAGVSANPVSGPTPLDVSFSSANSYDQDGSIVKYTWSFGDGTTSVEPDPYKTYSEPGTYEVVLTVEDNSGLTNSSSLNISVTNDSPVAVLAATPIEGELPLTVDFDATGSSDSDGTIVDYLWDFGDGFTESNTAQTSHTYNTEGNYTAKVTVYDNFGQVGYDYVTIKVLASSDFLAAPSNISATLVSDIAIISWDYAGSGQDGFYIERGSKVRGKYTWERIGLTTANDRSYADSGITKDQYYRVQAFDADTEEVSEYTTKILVRYDVTTDDSTEDGTDDKVWNPNKPIK